MMWLLLRCRMNHSKSAAAGSRWKLSKDIGCATSMPNRSEEPSSCALLLPASSIAAAPPESDPASKSLPVAKSVSVCAAHRTRQRNRCVVTTFVRSADSSARASSDVNQSPDALMTLPTVSNKLERGSEAQAAPSCQLEQRCAHGVTFQPSTPFLECQGPCKRACAMHLAARWLLSNPTYRWLHRPHTARGSWLTC